MEKKNSREKKIARYASGSGKKKPSLERRTMDELNLVVDSSMSPMFHMDLLIHPSNIKSQKILERVFNDLKYIYGFKQFLYYQYDKIESHDQDELLKSLQELYQLLQTYAEHIETKFGVSLELPDETYEVLSLQEINQRLLKEMEQEEEGNNQEKEEDDEQEYSDDDESLSGFIEKEGFVRDHHGNVIKQDPNEGRYWSFTKERTGLNVYNKQLKKLRSSKKKKRNSSKGNKHDSPKRSKVIQD
jgi:hypothetical protein